MKNLILLLWIFKLYHPIWMLSSFLPSLNHVKFLPTVLLIAVFVRFLFETARRKDYYPALLLFLVVNILSGVLAVYIGPPKFVIRSLAEYYALGVLTLTYIRDKQSLNKLLTIYLFHFLYYALWGLLGNGIVSWDYIMDEEDAFGPLMAIGFIFSYFYPSTGTKRKYSLALSILCLIGTVISFARGTFISVICLGFFIFMQSKNKLRIALSIGLLSCIMMFSMTMFFPNGEYLKEMKTSVEGVHSGTGADRWVLWQMAWDIFLDHPVLGVGPHNFGNTAMGYRSNVNFKTNELYADPKQLWGRAVHNIYFQLLSETGMLGGIAFLLLLLDWPRRNPRIARAETYWMKYKKSINLAILAYLINGIFYQMLYLNWIFDILILRRILTSTEINSEEGENVEKI